MPVQPDPKRQSNRPPSIWLVLLVGILAIWVALVLSGPAKRGTRSRAAKAPASAVDKATQILSTEQANDLVEKMIQTGVVIDVDVSPIYTYANVGRPFDQLTYKQKHICAMALHLYSLSHGGSSDVALRDAYTSKKIATYVSGTFSLR